MKNLNEIRIPERATIIISAGQSIIIGTAKDLRRCYAERRRATARQ